MKTILLIHIAPRYLGIKNINIWIHKITIFYTMKIQSSCKSICMWFDFTYMVDYLCVWTAAAWQIAMKFGTVIYVDSLSSIRFSRHENKIHFEKKLSYQICFSFVVVYANSCDFSQKFTHMKKTLSQTRIFIWKTYLRHILLEYYNFLELTGGEILKCFFSECEL